MFEISSQNINLRCFKLERGRKKTLGISLKKKKLKKSEIKDFNAFKEMSHSCLWSETVVFWLRNEVGCVGCWQPCEQWALLAVSVLSHRSPEQPELVCRREIHSWCLNTSDSLKSSECFNGSASKFLLSSIPENKVNWIYLCSLFLTF